MNTLLKFFLFTTLFTLTQTFNWLGDRSKAPCGRIPSSLSCEVSGFEDLEKITLQFDDEREKLYEKMKAEFLTSPFCEADKVLNDPTQRISPLLFKQALDDLAFIPNPNITRANKITYFQNFVEKYALNDEFKSYGMDLLQNYEDVPHGRAMVLTRLRGLAVQEMDKLSKTKPSYQVDDLKEGLADRGIFLRDDEGKVNCPFISHEAFMKALDGRDKILKINTLAGRISKKNQITIVDYSLPSNQRRMFVLDLNQGLVLHNTWTNQGRGNDGLAENGIDGFGSNPPMSNAPGSDLSSEGFMLATAASAGITYGPNVILDGIDLNNTKLKSRAVVLHGFRTPYHEFVSGKWEWNESQTKRILPAPDMYPALLKTDFKTASEDDMDEVVADLRGAALPYDRLDGTNGCLGVPEANARQLDRKGRNKSQLELLREDLPGSLMLNYTGPNMKSKFL